MKLTSFSVNNYRSITSTHAINLNDVTILLGKNNEGKSNIIKALATSMNIISDKYIMMRNPTRSLMQYYEWNRDFPISLQNRKNGLVTTFKLDFDLNDEELKELNSILNSRISSNQIKIQIKIGKDNNIVVKVPKKGTSQLTKKEGKVREFIQEKIKFNYIPAIRTEVDALEIIERNISQELKVLEKNEEYIQAVDIIGNLQKEILKQIEGKIKNTLVKFLPNIINVSLHIQDEKRRNYLRRNIDVIIDDGNATNIEYKGDGIKSLVSLAMLTDKYNVDGASVIAIDEPESHLHPGAITELNNVIFDLSKDNQVIISTHNPIFVNANNIKSNIIVENGKAKPAKNIEEIRRILGVKVTDNLINADKILIVEGETDKLVINKILSKNVEIKKCLDNGSLRIEVLNGASKLNAKLYQLKNYVCKYHVFLDNDNEAMEAYQQAKDDKNIELKNITFVNLQHKGMKESEIEDCYNKEIYERKIMEKYAVNINVGEFKSAGKWSCRMKNVFISQSKIWDDEIEKDIKILVAQEIITSKEESILNEHKKDPIVMLEKNIEKMICDKKMIYNESKIRGKSYELNPKS